MAQVSRAQKYTETDKQQEAFSDFLVDFDPHPNTQDLVRNTNEMAVKRSIKNLIFTNKFERLMQPNRGSNIINLLFEPISSITSGILRNTITEVIEQNEPRVKLISVEVEPIEQNQSYRVYISFFIINRTEPSSLVVNLYRIR